MFLQVILSMINLRDDGSLPEGDDQYVVCSELLLSSRWRSRIISGKVPDPVRLVLLGLIDAGLPTTEAALIELHIDVLGILDFGAKTLSIDGSLYDSRVLIFSLAGDLALQHSWGDNPNFLFSLGGFNPHFSTAGLGCPPMHRLTVSIGDGDNPRISANSYFAITSNSLQFGSNVEAYAFAAAGFTIHGWLGFDVNLIACFALFFRV